MPKTKMNPGKKIHWHKLVGATLKSLLEPVGIDVHWDVPVTILSPLADILFLQRKQRRTEEQRMLLADGLRDLDVDHILAELKVTENLDDTTLTKVASYEYFYCVKFEVVSDQIRSAIISAITPRQEYLKRFHFEPVGPKGVYVSESNWGNVVRLILLNELTNEPHNAPLKCFASRYSEQKKAFVTIQESGLFKISEKYHQIITGLWSLIMRGALNKLQPDEVTPDIVMQLGKEWFETMVNSTPDKDLMSLPKLEHILVQRTQDSEQKGRQEGEAEMLLKLIRRKFGQTPDWVAEKVKAANLELIETWSDNFVFANSVDEVFAS